MWKMRVEVNSDTDIIQGTLFMIGFMACNWGQNLSLQYNISTNLLQRFSHSAASYTLCVYGLFSFI